MQIYISLFCFKMLSDVNASDWITLLHNIEWCISHETTRSIVTGVVTEVNVTSLALESYKI